MTRISFYVLASSIKPEVNDLDIRSAFTCRLCEKAYRQGSQVYIAVNSKEEADQLNQLLWDFKPESFIPHKTNEDPNLMAPVVIGLGNDLEDHHGLLINLRDKIPDEFSRFDRLAEIVSQDERTLIETRSHFAFYRDRGYPIETHKIAHSD